MSDLAFQKALATVVRFPLRPAKEILDSFCADLTRQEEERLQLLINDPLVLKYGKKMQYVRHREAMGVLRFSRQVVAPEILDSIYFSDFEPQRTMTDALWLGVEFLDFLLSDPALRAKVEANAPKWALDCLSYECAKAFVSRHVPKESDPTLPPSSALCYKEFKTLNLEYDIPEFETQWVQTGELPKMPLQRSLTVLFIPSHASPFYRMFEIDRDVQSFLNIQRDFPEVWGPSMPEYFDAMKAVGLVGRS